MPILGEEPSVLVTGCKLQAGARTGFLHGFAKCKAAQAAKQMSG